MNEILKTVEEFIVKHRICGNVLIGFSGGVDSMCLADIMHRLSASHKINLTAVHLNHNWRGKDSLQDEINCKNFCQELGINFYSETLSDDIPNLIQKQFSRLTRHLIMQKQFSTEYLKAQEQSVWKGLKKSAEYITAPSLEYTENKLKNIAKQTT